MFIMLIGVLPFKGLNYDEIVINNYHCNIDLNQYAPKLSIQAFDVLSKILSKDAAQRPTPKEILEFAWFN